MSTRNKQFLEVRVVDIDRQPIENAKIVGSGAGARSAGRGRYLLGQVSAVDIPLTVEAPGYETVACTVRPKNKINRVDIIMAPPGTPAFRRKGVRVPFRSPEDQLGIITRSAKAAQAVEQMLRKHKLSGQRQHSRDLTIVQVPPDRRDEVARVLRSMPEVKAVGRLVNPSARGTGILTSRIIVRTKPGTSADEVKAIANVGNCTVARKLALKDRWVLAVDDGDDFAVLKAADKLSAHPSVLEAEPDVAFTADPDAINPTDELYDEQWHLVRVGAAEAWQHLRDANAPGVAPGDPADLTFGSANILIAVMDTGVKSVTDGGGNVTPEHPEFQGTVTNGAAKVDGFFDFGGMVANNDDPMAVFGDGYHGSSCAGVAAARANNPSGVGSEEEGGSGAAPNCRILAVQGPNPCTEEEYSDMYLWIAGIDPGNPDPAFPALPAQGADVITNSWGGYNPAVWPISALMDDLFTTITDNGRGGLGTLMFFSTGNGYSGDFWDLRPFAAHERNFGIGASTDGDVKAGYSNWGDGVDLCAPSSGGTEGITTTTIPGDGDTAGHTGGPLDYVDDFGGTSSATPLAAGVGALLLSMDPTLTWQEARTVLTRTAKRIDYSNTDPDGQWRDVDMDGVAEYSWWYGFGMVDAARAVCVARNTISVDPVVTFVDIPEEEVAIRPVTIRLHGWRSRTFIVTSGPTTLTGPAGSFVLHAGNSVVYPGSFDCAEVHAHLWLRYTGTTAGDTATGEVTIQCAETGESWNISISANTIVRPTAAIVLALDRSGSMNDQAGDGRLKIELVRDSAAVVPVLCDDETGLGAVRWDTDADIAGAMDVLEAGDEIGGAGRTALATFVAGHTTNLAGMTAIGDAVEASQDLLDDAADYDVKAMIVLTDGNETEPKYLADLAPDQLHSRIFAIGVGTPENIQPNSLATLTGATDGYLLMTGNIDSNDTFLLTKYYQQILAGITNTEIVVDPQGILSPGGSLRLPFPVNETDRSVDAIVHCPLPWLLDFRIEAPDGQIFGPAQATGIDARYVVGPGTAYYRMLVPNSIVGPQNPAQPWHALIRIHQKRWRDYLRKVLHQDPKAGSSAQRAASRLVHGLRYAFTAQARSSLQMQVNVTQSGREPGATAWLRAKLTEYGYPLNVPSAVRAVVTDPGGNTTSHTLTSIGNGMYEASLVATLSGAWRVTFHAKGRTSQGSPYLRESLRTIAVWPGGNRPGPSSPPVSAGEQLLRCLCGGKVIDPDVAKKFGIDLKELCECLKRGKDPKHPPKDCCK